MPFDSEVKVENETKLVLQRARDLVAKGWCQGTMFKIDCDGEQSFCVVGAIRTVAASSPNLGREFSAIRAFSATLPEDYRSYPAFWNDEPGRTQAEVLAVFDKAIASL